MSHDPNPNPQPPRRRRNFRQNPTHWQKMWAKHPGRLREHIDRMAKIREEKSAERGRLIQAIFDLMPTEPMRPYELRDLLAHEWETTYGEPIDKKKAWSIVRAAQRRGMVGQTDDNLYFVRHSV